MNRVNSFPYYYPYYNYYGNNSYPYYGNGTGYNDYDYANTNYIYSATNTCFCRDPDIVASTPTTEQRCLTADGTCGVCVDRNVTPCSNCDDSYTSLCQ